MKKLKDFLYDKSDLLIALAILLIAATLIAWRLDAIMEYPKEIVQENDHQTEFPAPTPDENEGQEGSEGEGSTETTDPNEGSEGEGEDEGSTEESNKPLWEGGVLTKDVTVTVKGNSATAAVQCLVDAGLFESYDEYANLCQTQGVSDPESVIAGTFTFKAGTDKQTVLSKVNWS